MLVFEINLKIKFGQVVPYEETYEKLGNFIDLALSKEQDYLQFHNQNQYKWYCVDLPYPIEKERVYQKRKIYSIRIRTVRQDLAEYFIETLVRHRTNEIWGVGGELKIIPRKTLERVYNITPVIIKTETGYWRGKITTAEFENRLKVNLIKKYNQIHDTKIDENFELFNLIEFKNEVPIKVPYKNVVLLGDKLNIVVANNKMAQELMYMALGTGLGEMNARGLGTLNYRFL